MSVKSAEKRKYVSIENFIRAYESLKHKTVIDVANSIGIKPAAVSIRASKLRKKGVNLRVFDRVHRSNIVEKANAILAAIKK
jgi:hypothetical protein